MSDRELHTESNDERKARIRERYKGMNRDQIEVIPAVQEINVFEEQADLRVAVYARVSTDDPNQTSSYELQKNHYQDMVVRHPGWQLVRIYADEGISGTSLQHRDEFVQMIKDCEEGLIDIIVTKSVSRFARNVLDCIGHVRKLAALPHPVGVYFETEGIYTLNKNSEMILTILSTTAQEESHVKSEIMNASIEMRFSRGIFLTPALLGYDLDEDGNLVINDSEALTVRLCFFMYLFGYSCSQIAETLMKLGRVTKRGNTRWTAGSVLQVLQNERHCGDILSRKTWTPNYLDHKSKKNRQNRPQYRARNHHEAIISRDDFIAVQRLITNAKYGHKGYLPSLHVIETGALRGFVEINPKWSGFTKQDYFDAVESICPAEQEDGHSSRSTVVHAGEFDLRGYEIARGQFFQPGGDVAVTFSMSDLIFSKACIRKLDQITHVQLLFDPIQHLLAVRPTSKEDRHGVNWAKIYERSCTPRTVSGSAFLPTLYDILGWKPENKYRICGVRRQRDNEIIILFDLHDTEVYIPVANNGHGKKEPFEVFEKDVTPISPNRKTQFVAYPAEWANSFGREYYTHEQSPELAPIDLDGKWDVQQQGTPYHKSSDVSPTSPDDLRSGITSLITTMSQEAHTDED